MQAELNEYKLKFEQLDSKFKSERKLLAREVKTLRAKVETLTVEKTQMSSKLQVLRQALSIDGPSGSSSSGAIGSGHSSHSSSQHSPAVPNAHTHGHHSSVQQTHSKSAPVNINSGNEPDLAELMAFSRQQSQQQNSGGSNNNNKPSSKKRGTDESDGAVNQFW